MSAPALPALRGDVCPGWCSGDHGVQRNGTDGDGAFHRSAPVDTWVGIHPDGREPILVFVEGYRHDHPELPDGTDWPDDVEVGGPVSPGCLGGVSLPAVDARRLGLALIAAADLIDASPQGEVSYV